MTYPNRYKGDCSTCGTFVPAGAGIYEQGQLTCTDTIGVDNGDRVALWLCVPAYNQHHGTTFTEWADAFDHRRASDHDQVVQGQETTRLELVNGKLAELATRANIKSLAQVIAKITGAERELADLDFSQATAVRAELQKRIQRKRSAQERGEFQKSNTCNRCGGAGGADKWKHTGTICYKCGGSGKYYNN